MHVQYRLRLSGQSNYQIKQGQGILSSRKLRNLRVILWATLKRIQAMSSGPFPHAIYTDSG